MLLGLHIEHELRERTVQPGNRAAHEAEAGAGQLGAGREIQPQRLTNVHVVAHGEVKHPGRAPAAQLHVAFFPGTDGHALVRQVGHRQQQSGQLGLNHLKTLRRLLQLALERIDLRHGGVGLGVLAFALVHANLLGELVALALQRLSTRLQRFALALQRLEGGHIQKGLGLFSGLQPGNHAGQVFSQLGDV